MTLHGLLGSCRALAVFAATSAALSGCTIATGQRGVLSFRVASEDEPLWTPNPRLPVARGSTVTYVVTTRDGTPTRDVTGARINPANLATVEELGRSELTVRFFEVGVMTLNVTALRGRDSLMVRSAEVHAASVQHWTNLLHELEPWVPKAVFLSGSSARFILDATDPGGAPLIGFGVEPPLHGEPGGHTTITAQAGDLSHVSVTFLQAGRSSLRPLRGPPLEVEVIDEASLDTFDLLVAPASSKPETQPFRLILATTTTAAGQRTLASDRLVWSTATPAVCVVDYGDLARRWGEGAAAVILSRTGTCVVEATLGDKNARLRLFPGETAPPP